ncbi:MAG: hypothetical protein PF487_10320 [Bacteroidales bacterium]|jgi:hypothetical protein|nr:hypothetical protein [Bacteroidales bacterium]
MKNFIKKSLFFLLPLVLLAYPFDLLLSYYLKQSHSYLGEFEVWNDIYSGEIDAEIAIYGSSRAWVQINPELFEEKCNISAYNFGIDGHNFNAQYLRHLEYFKYNKKPKVIILVVDIFTLDKRADLYGLIQFLPYMLWNENIKSYTTSYIGFTKYDYKIPFIRYAGRKDALKVISTSVLNRKQNYRHNGFRGKDFEWNEDLQNAKLNGGKYQINIDSASVKLFDNFLFDCRANNIDVIFVYPPEYIVGQSFIANKEQAMIQFYLYQKKYNLLFLDYTKHALSFDQSNFYNTLHLNKKGADNFTHILINDIKKNASLYDISLF